MVTPPGVISVQETVTVSDTPGVTPSPVTSVEETITVADAGLAAASSTSNASISDYAWKDSTGNGVQDAGEPPFAAIVVKLLDGASGSVLASTTTNGAGNYLFSGLGAGSYKVQFVAPAGWSFTLKDQGSDDTKDSAADPATGITGAFALAASASDTTRDAGLVQTPGATAVPAVGIPGLALGALAMAVLTGLLASSRKRSDQAR